MVATPGTIPALVPYQPAALHLTGQEAVEIVSSLIATSAISGSMLLTDFVGKAPSVLPDAAADGGDRMAFYQGSTGVPKSTSVEGLLVSVAALILATAGLILPLPPNIVTTAGTFTLAATNFGDVLVDVNALVTVQLPAASARANYPVTIADIGGFAGSNTISILPFGAETIIGQASLSITNGYASFSLAPIPTGGWYQK